MTIFEDTIAKLKLFWQYPVITEQTVFKQQLGNPCYYGIPWATLLDKNYNIQVIFKLLQTSTFFKKNNFLSSLTLLHKSHLQLSKNN